MYDTLLQEMTGVRLFHEEEALLNHNECVQLRDNIDSYTTGREERINTKKKVCEIYFNSSLMEESQPEQFLITVEEKGKNKSFILKRKNYIGKYGNETSVKISREQYANIIKGSLDWMKNSSKVLINEFYCKIKLFQYKISRITKCYREEIYLKLQQLQITIDEDIKTFAIGTMLPHQENHMQKSYIRIRSTQIRRGDNENKTLIEELLK